MQLVVFLSTMVLALGPTVLIGWWILGPIDRAAKFREAPVRFSIGDFLCLFLALQIPLAVIYQLVSREERRLLWLFTFLTWVMAPVIWFACARALSKAGVTRATHRFVFLGLIMPIVYYALVPFICLTVAGGLAIAMGNPLELSESEWLMAAWVALACMFYAGGVITRGIVRHARHCEQPISEMEHRLQLARSAIDAISKSHRSTSESTDA